MLKTTICAFMILAGALPAAAAAPLTAGTTSFPDGYWERNWGFSGSAATYQLVLKVGDVDKAAVETEKMLVDAGGTSSGGSNGYYPPNAGQRPRTFQYTLKFEGADKIAKKLMDLGDLQNYSVMRSVTPAIGKELDDRLALVAAELESNKAALKKMPVSNYFLTAQSTRLKAAKAAYEASAAKAMIVVTLSDAPASPMFR